MSDWLETVGAGVFYVAMTGLFFIGIYHSYDKHDDALYIWSPFAVYRGIEFIFHDDEEEWESELPNVTYFLNNMNYDNPPDFNSDFNEFKKRIDDFSDDGILYLRDFADVFLAYRMAFDYDFESSIQNLEFGDDVHFIISASTKKLRDKLTDYGFENHLELEDKTMANLAENMNENIHEVTYDELEDMKSEIKINSKTQKEVYNFAYKRIFK